MQIERMKKAGVCTALAMMAALSTPTAVAQSAHTSEQMQAINSETAIVRAQIELEEARARLAKLQGETTPKVDSRSIEIASISRFGSRIGATLRMPNGADMDVVRGSRLPDGSLVSDIRFNGVTLKKGGKSWDLVLAGSAVPQATPLLPAGMPTILK